MVFHQPISALSPLNAKTSIVFVYVESETPRTMGQGKSTEVSGYLVDEHGNQMYYLFFHPIGKQLTWQTKFRVGAKVKLQKFVIENLPDWKWTSSATPLRMKLSNGTTVESCPPEMAKKLPTIRGGTTTLTGIAKRLKTRGIDNTLVDITGVILEISPPTRRTVGIEQKVV
jgi:hypothetical protein